MVEVGCEVRDLMGWGKRNLERKGWVGRWVLVNVSFMWFHFLRWLCCPLICGNQIVAWKSCVIYQYIVLMCDSLILMFFIL